MATLQAVTTAPGVALADARFIDLVTFRRSGVPVRTPVLFAQDGDRLLVRTAAGVGKLKRLAHTPDRRAHAEPTRRAATSARPVTGRHASWGRMPSPRRSRAPRAVPRSPGRCSTAVRQLRGQQDVIIEILLDAVP